MSEAKETWPNGMSVRSRTQLQRDESRDRQKHTKGWYFDGVSHVEGKAPKPKWDGYAERSMITRPDIGDAFCERCKGSNVSYIDQVCYDCSHEEE